MRRVSKKRAVLIRRYTVLRRQFLAENPWCIRCGGQATEVHHARGRVGGDLLNVETWRPACHDCHMHFGAYPAEAISRGWSLPRIGRSA